MLREIRAKNKAIRDDVDDLVTYRALPVPSLAQVDPFLFLNHHGPQVYPPNNNGLPFGPHPHRGFETVTLILDGDVAHRDSTSRGSVIKKGGVQWMTAGRGIVHEEMSSAEFMEKGGGLEVLQLWVNLPARLKMTAPAYHGFQADQIPVVDVDGTRVRLISGTWNNYASAHRSLTDVTLKILEMRSAARFRETIAATKNIFFYVVHGNVAVNQTRATSRELVEFQNVGDELQIEAETDAIILLGHADPLNEPVVAHGPFVMNTREEIVQAIRDFQEGRLR